MNTFWLRHLSCCLLIASATLAAGQDADLQTTHRIPLTITWGHTSPPHSEFAVRVVGREVALDPASAVEQEPTDAFALGDEFWQTRAGGADVDGIACTLTYRDMPLGTIADLNSMWRDLISQSDPDTARRLQQDAGMRLDARQLTIQLNRDATRGFTVTIDQLLQHRAFWVPELDLFVAVGDDPPTLDAHRQEMMRSHGTRILDQVHREPDANYAQYTARWEDMGSPAYEHPSQPAPGHIVGLTWDSAVPKFGIDSGAGVWNDLGNPDRFRLECDMGQLTQELKTTWRGQCLADGLPILTTRFAREPVRVQIEQFAYPLHGPPSERRGDISLVLLQKIIVENTSDAPQVVPLRLTHRRERPAGAKLACVREGDRLIIQDATSGQALLYVQGANVATSTFAELAAPAADTGAADTGTADAQRVSVEIQVSVEAPAAGTKELEVRLPSPVVSPEDLATLSALDYATARQATGAYWSDWLARGAQFRVPEQIVNDLYRASLWHALRLPRRHGGSEPGVRIDLPYSNFAYDQQGTPWPVNQAVYVDYMIYDLRGYHDVSLDELLHMYRNNQQPDGRIGGYANWGVYTPSMVYASAQHYLLSHDRAAFERLLPPTLKALDWCLQQMHSSANDSSSMGLVRAPLNDLTGEGLWAFNQAYVYAALQTLGEALDRFGHPRAGECLAAAREFATVVERAFAAAAVQSPLVQLRDGNWMPYVPCEATTPRRRFDQWYPTDVDTGAVHLLRLGALPARGLLADCLLHDHEDNLYLHGWGMANEPVYNQQATAYLLRDDPQAAVRAFYSYMACAFSHSALEPVEHRWTWGQYFGPPSTDGAWFDLYRHMLIEDRQDDRLLLFQATPRPWLEDGKSIEIERAPTRYGPLWARIDSRAASGEIQVEIRAAFAPQPQRLCVRLRHPQGKPLLGVKVNGTDWKLDDPAGEWITIAGPAADRYVIHARY